MIELGGRGSAAAELDRRTPDRRGARRAVSTLPLRLCLVGAGIARSPSPVIHQAAMQSSGVEGTYVLRDLVPDDIEGFVAELRKGRYTGCNVTAPYKARDGSAMRPPRR